MYRLPIVTFASLVLAAPGAAAQTAARAVSSTIVEWPGKTIEIVGLKRWTPGMLQDSLSLHSPGDSLHQHACAASLRYKLGFAEAAAFSIQQRDGTLYTFLPLVEPQDSALVRHRALPLDTTGSAAPWAPLIKQVRGADDQRAQMVSMAVNARLRGRALGLPPALPPRIGTDSVAVREIWAYLDAHAAPADAKEARRVLLESPYLYDRLAAVIILSSFDRDDATWHALMGAQLEADGAVRFLASQLLEAFVREVPRPLDWRPAARELHAILNGGNVATLHDVLDVLVATGVNPTLARPLLARGGHAVLLYAGASYPMFRGPAHRFLRAVSGEDFGGDLGQWQAWVAGL